MTWCEHKDFRANVEVNRLTKDDDDPTIVAFAAEIHVCCNDCGEPFVFHGAGLPIGMLNDRPCISPDGKELRVPLRPESSDPHLGLGIAGFQARIYEGQRGGEN